MCVSVFGLGLLGLGFDVRVTMLIAAVSEASCSCYLGYNDLGVEWLAVGCLGMLSSLQVMVVRAVHTRCTIIHFVMPLQVRCYGWLNTHLAYFLLITGGATIRQSSRPTILLLHGKMKSAMYFGCLCVCVCVCLCVCVSVYHKKCVRICSLASIASFGDIVIIFS